MKKYNAIAACCVLSAIVSAAAVQAELLNVNLLTNGSFEDSPLGTNVNPVTGWSLTGMNGLIDGVNDSRSVVESWGVIPEDGDRQFRFQGTSNLFIEQTITLDGGDYSLSAWFAGRNNAPSNYLPTSSVVFELRNSGGTVITPVESSSPSIPENSTGGTTGSWVNWTREYTGIAAGDYSVR